MTWACPSSYTLGIMNPDTRDITPEDAADQGRVAIDGTLAAPAVVQASPAAASFMDRPRPVREPLVPKWVPITLAVLVASAVLVVAFVLLSGGAAITVPRVIGIDVGVARTRLAQADLEMAIDEERFSSLPQGTVMEQRPAPGDELKRGETVSVVVSAGSETFAMPDLVGTGLAYARGQLEGKGLQIRIVQEPSDQASDTVLATNPAAGSSMLTGDIVSLTVATAGVGADILLPTSMQGVTVTLDPEPVASDKPDITLDVARRLRSLLEASGATVMPTRALADTGTAVSEDVRVKRAKEGAPTVAVGFGVSTQGKGGLVAFGPLTGPTAAQSSKLASQIASSLASSGLPATTSGVPSDKVLAATAAPYSRLQLGSFSVREDAAAFADPTWADRVARAVYKALAEAYGRTEPKP